MSFTKRDSTIVGTQSFLDLDFTLFSNVKSRIQFSIFLFLNFLDIILDLFVSFVLFCIALMPFREYRERRKAETGNSAEYVPDCRRRRERRTCDADEARALFRMNFYEISRHKTHDGPIGTYVRTLHPVEPAVAAKHKSSRDRLGCARQTLEIKID